MMHQNKRVLKIFVASPGDVLEERDSLSRIVEELNRTTANSRGVTLELVRWETHASPSMGRPQAVINQQTGDMGDYALFIGILWSRFGTPTGDAASGTEEELNRAVAAMEATGQPEIKVYFGQKPFNPKTTQEAEQKLKILQFKERIQPLALTWDYPSPLEFERSVREHINSWLLSIDAATPAPAVQIEGTSTVNTAQRPVEDQTKAVDDSGNWVLLGNGFFLPEEVSADSNGSIDLKIIAESAAVDAHIKTLRSSSESVGYCHRNEACFVKVTETKLTSTSEKAYWMVTLKVAHDFKGQVLAEAGTTDYTADQIAVLRARRILLNEKPIKDSHGNYVQPADGNHVLPMLVTGISTYIKAEQGAISYLAAISGEASPAFLQQARLLCVFTLLGSLAVSEILSLELSFSGSRAVRVSFEGRRGKIYHNTKPPVIEVEGICHLDR